MQERIKAWVQAHREYILETNRKLVQAGSENLYPRGNEKRTQLIMKSHLEQIGFTTDLFTPDEVPGLKRHEAYLNDGRIYEDRPNLVGILKGKGGGRSLIFSGHADTAPLSGEKWDFDPFGGEVADGKQYGLGIFDMKGGMSAAILAAQCLRELDIELEGDLLIESVVDEEFGGANGTLACRLRGYDADAAIIPEPTNMVVCPANQGGAYYRAWFEGVSGRSYSGEALINPVNACASFVEVVKQYGEWRNAKSSPPPLFEGQPLVTVIQAVHAGDTRFDLGDRVPKTCFVDVWLQCWPGVGEESLFEEFTGFVGEAAKRYPILAAMPPRFEKKMRFLPGTSIGADHPIVKTLLEAGALVRESGLICGGAPFACDSFIFNRHSSTPAVIFGPRGGNAHSANEFIWVEDFLTLVELYAMTMAIWCGVHNREGVVRA